MKKFSFILIVALAVLASCENNKKQCYQFTTKVAGQTVTTYDNCTKAVAEELLIRLSATEIVPAQRKPHAGAHGTQKNYPLEQP